MSRNIYIYIYIYIIIKKFQFLIRYGIILLGGDIEIAKVPKIQ